MSLDMCRLVEDLLPLYVDDLLSRETRRAVEKHAETCSVCARRLVTAGMEPAIPPKPVEEPPPDAAARSFFGRLRRIGFYGLVGAVLLLVLVGSISYQVGGRWSGGVKSEQPLQVADGIDLARKLVPGWERAAATGQLVTLNQVIPIPSTEATMTLEQAWFGEERSYILYRVTAPEGGHYMPTEAFTEPNGSVERPWGHQLGGFSNAGFHQVMVIPHEHLVPEKGLRLQFRRWVPIKPGDDWNDFAQRRGITEEFTVSVAVPTDALTDRFQQFPLDRKGSWLGRSLALSDLQVGGREVRLSGYVDLPMTETDPNLGLTLRVGSEELRSRRVEVQPTGTEGRWWFRATYEPPNQWPAPVKLQLWAIGFARKEPLVWTVPWNRYRGPERTDLEPAERPVASFYDSKVTLVGFHHKGRGIHFENLWPSTKAPNVRFQAVGDMGVAVIGQNGYTITNLGGGYGPLEGKVEHWSIFFGEEDEAGLEDSDSLTIRVGAPRGVMTLEEVWELELVGR